MRQREQAAALLGMAAQDLYLTQVHANDVQLGNELWGFHAQQAAEKLLKALLSAKGVQYPLTHRLVPLANLARDSGVAIPERLEALWDLTPYAAKMRYTQLAPESKLAGSGCHPEGAVRTARSGCELRCAQASSHRSHNDQARR